MGAYDPNSRDDRATLADRLISALTSMGFAEVASPGERVFGRAEGPGLECRVYTTIVGDRVRELGADAIHVSLVYTGSSPPRGCGKQRRVHRTGEIEAIVERVKDRISNASEGLERCYCGAPKFRAKSNKMVCAALCWKQTTARPIRESVKPVPPTTPPVRPASVKQTLTTIAGRRNKDAPKGRSW